MNLQRLEELLERMRDVRVLVVGDVMLDIYLRGSSSRISPEAPVPVVRVSEQDLALGGAANVAANIVALGAQCMLAGAVGADSAGRDLIAELNGCGIDTRGLLQVAS